MNTDISLQVNAVNLAVHADPAPSYESVVNSGCSGDSGVMSYDDGPPSILRYHLYLNIRF